MYENYFKRIFDIIISTGLILCLLPLLLFIIILVKLDSPGPVFFLQPRVGHHLKMFTIFKIRTMTLEACTNALDPTQTYVTTAEDDPRVTTIGRFLRKTHLDELPQLFNICLGHMSLVGVRPDAPSQITQYSPNFWKKRHQRRPGLTGLSQINSGNPDFSLAQNKRLDIFYARHNNLFFLDLYILYKTAMKLLRFNSI